jgi:hypothetical protein
MIFESEEGSLQRSYCVRASLAETVKVQTEKLEQSSKNVFTGCKTADAEQTL